MSDLPAGWTETTLGEIGRYINGRGFKRSEWRESGRPIIRIQNLTGTSGEFNYFDGEADERHVVRKGDLLVSWAATLGVYKWTGEEAVLNQHIFKVESHINPDFHRYLVQHALDDLYRQAHGSGMVHITKGKFDQTPVLLPPLPEQGRIVAALDEHLSHVTAAERSLQRAQRNLERMWVARLGSTVDGPEVPLSDCILEATYGTSTKCAYDASGPAVLRIPNVVGGSIDMSDLKYAIRPQEVSDSAYVLPGDLLLVRTNGSRNLIGRTAVVPHEGAEGLAFASYLIRLRVQPEVVSPEYLHLALRSPMAREQLERQAATTAGQYNLSVSKLNNIGVRVPDRQTQLSAVTELEDLSDLLGRQTRAVALLLARADQFRRSILNAALSGRVVEQNSTDEPASALLERHREADSGKQSSRRKKHA